MGSLLSREKMIIKCFKEDEKLTDGFSLIPSYEVERLIDEDFAVFKDLELSIDVGYYALRNKNSKRYLWLSWVGSGSGIVGGGRLLDSLDGVHGVLAWKK